ncbi:DUF2599 domain-containing protein [Cellulomonas sp. P22]|uniref:DUF2599 domain-containing protein n=1 Tax=Cellulomonas sp. P22 TaxID=3373189 RepID=UPI0037ABAC80
MLRRTRTERRAAVPAVTLALGAALLAGCTGTATPAPSPPTVTTPGPARTPSPGPRTADDVRAHGAPLTAGDVTLTAAATAGDPRTETLDDGSVRLTLAVADATAAPALVVTLAAPSGSTFDVLGDGSVELRDPDGALTGGLAAPTTTTSGDALKARFTAVGDDILELSVTALTRAATLPAGTVTLWFGTRMLDDPADWGEREGGRSLAVRPTTWARAGGLAAQEGVWAAVIAQEPEADTNGMHDQLLCHAVGAPDKAAWNLEPWRPDVGSLATLAARCNPT